MLCMPLERISRHCCWRRIGGQLCAGMFGVPIFYQITCVFIVVFTRLKDPTIFFFEVVAENSTLLTTYLNATVALR